MPKGNFWNDTADEIMEFGVSTAKATATNVVKSLNPVQSILENKNTTAQSGDPGIEKMQSQMEKSKSTPLNFAKLQNTYADQDKIKVDAMRNRLFQLVKGDESKAIAERKREEEERKNKELYGEQEKKKREYDAHQQQSQSDAPRGKVHRTIGAAHKKVADNSHQEVKANKSSG